MKLSISNILIIISVIFTLISFSDSEILLFWMNKYFLSIWDYVRVFFQFCIYSFLHWNLMHLGFNSLFIYIFWNQVENIIWTKKYIIFFIFVSILNWITILFLTYSNTIWISGFAMALLTFYTLKLYQTKNSDYKWWITAIIVNILIWLNPTISLVGHLFWSIFWALYFLLIKKL